MLRTDRKNVPDDRYPTGIRTNPTIPLYTESNGFLPLCGFFSFAHRSTENGEAPLRDQPSDQAFRCCGFPLSGE